MKNTLFQLFVGLLLTATLVGATPTAVAAASPAQKAIQPAVVISNPWGCVVQANNPHLSGHYPGTAAASAQISCSDSVPNLELQVWLYYQWCFFFVCTWNQADFNGVYVQGRNYVYLTAAANCNNSNSTPWQIVAAAKGWFDNGTTDYTATVSNTQTFQCGR